MHIVIIDYVSGSIHGHHPLLYLGKLEYLENQECLPRKPRKPRQGLVAINLREIIYLVVFIHLPAFLLSHLKDYHHQGRCTFST